MSRPRRTARSAADSPRPVTPRAAPDPGPEAPPPSRTPRKAPSASRIATPDQPAPTSPARMPRPRRKTAAAPPSAEEPAARAPARPPRRIDADCAAVIWPGDEFVFDRDPILPDFSGPSALPHVPAEAVPAAATARPRWSAALVPGEAAREIARIRAGMVQIRQMIDGPLPTGEAAWTMLQRLCRDPLPHGHQAGSTTAMARLMAFPPSAISSRAGSGGDGLTSGGKRAVRARKAQGLLSPPKSVQGSAGNTMPGARGIQPASPPRAPIAGSAEVRPVTPAAIGPASWPALWSGVPIACLSETDPVPADPLMPATWVPQHSAAQPFTSWPVASGLRASGIAEVAPARARSRVAQLLAAWADWLLWRLQPPRIPQVGSQDDPSPVTAGALFGPDLSTAAALDPVSFVAPTAAEGSATPNDAMPASAEGDRADPGHHIAEDRPQDLAPISGPTLTDEAVALALVRALADNSLRARLQDMIRDELAGEMGARFSSNLQAVIRREVATGLDDRLTHL